MRNFRIIVGRILLDGIRIYFILTLVSKNLNVKLNVSHSVLDVAVEREEIFILEGPRSILRIAPNPDTYSDGMAVYYYFICRISFQWHLNPHSK